MSCCTSSLEDQDPAMRESRKRSSDIDKELKESYKIESKRTKILLLGAGESGKSTVLRQIRFMQPGQTTSKEDREELKEVLFQNTIQSMAALLSAVIERGQNFETLEAKKAANVIHQVQLPQSHEVYISKCFPAIKLLKDQGIITELMLKSNELQLNDSASYYFNAIDRMSDPAYLPSDDDILRVRIKTVGIQEVFFDMDNFKFRIFDVGGQKSERRKWLTLFEGVDVLLFVVAASEYDQMMYEDSSSPRWADAETLYDATVNSRWLSNSLLVLFLNKMDIFKYKIEQSDSLMSDYFEDYKEADNRSFHKAGAYLLRRLTKLHRDPSRRFYHHLTCATDTNQMKRVLKSVMDNTIQSNLNNAGLI